MENGEEDDLRRALQEDDGPRIILLQQQKFGTRLSDQSPPVPGEAIEAVVQICDGSDGGESSQMGESRTPSRANLAVKLICPDGLQSLPEISASEDDDVVEVIDVEEAAAAAKCEKKLRQKTYDVSRRCQDL